MEKARSLYSGLEDLAKTIALPEDYPPHRMPTFPALERTAVMSFMDTSVLPVAGGTSTPLALFRSPTYPLWAPGSMPGSMYSMAGRAIGITAGTENVPVFNELGTITAGTGMTSRPHLYPLVRHGNDLFYCLGMRTATTGTDQMVFGVQFDNMIGGFASNNGLIGEFEMIDANGERYSTNGVFSSPVLGGGDPATTVFTSWQPPSGVFAIRLLNLTATAGPSGLNCGPWWAGITPSHVAYGLTKPSSVVVPRLFPLTEPPELAVTNLPYQSVRATATSVLLSNVTAVMKKEGTATAARLQIGALGALDPTAWGSFGRIHPKDRYFAALEHGVYSYTLPDAQSEIFQDAVIGQGQLSQQGQTWPNRGVFTIDGSAFVNCIILTDLDAGTANSDTSQFAVRLIRHIEFRTSSRLFQTSFSKVSLDSYHLAQMALADIGCFTENPIHPALIGSMVMKAARLAWPHVKPVVHNLAVTAGNKAAGAVAKYLGPKNDMSQKQMVLPQTSDKKSKKNRKAVASRKGKKAK